MKITVNEKSDTAQNAYIEKVIDNVSTILAETKKILGEADEFETAFYLLTAKSQLSKLLIDMTEIPE